MIGLMLVAIFARDLPLPMAVIGHEGGTVLVSLNGLRLLGYFGMKGIKRIWNSFPRRDRRCRTHLPRRGTHVPLTRARARRLRRVRNHATGDVLLSASPR